MTDTDKLEPGCCARCGYDLGPEWTEVRCEGQVWAYHHDCVPGAIIGPRLTPPEGSS